MEDIVLQILDALRRGETVDDRALVKLVHTQVKKTGADKSAYAKRRLLPFYLRVKSEEPERWARWQITPEIERKLIATLRMKPRRSASGVATITVITKPWPCSGACLFCPSDVRCPKSYLADEPACARAVQACFDPYLQVSARLSTLAQMGHPTDKIELIVLGGTWSDYPEEYQVWFMCELFRALNDRDAAVGGYLTDGVRARSEFYKRAGILHTGNERFPDAIDDMQRRVTAGELSYNQAVAQLYGADSGWQAAARMQRATMDELVEQQRRNERAAHRVVGLVIETRPDAITPQALVQIRRMGATKIQMGVQSTDQRILDENNRGIRIEQIERAFSLLRLFGFKIHAHMMVNLLRSTPESDMRDYKRFVTSPAFQPDEVKLYPCALIESARLREQYELGAWRPYDEDELVGVLIADILATPAFCRVSRMIRDFSTGDIIAGNKKPNLRQLVEERLRAQEASVREIRYREIATGEVDVATLRLDEVTYETATTSERFLQWVTPEGRIAGFLRLSLPDAASIEALLAELTARGEAIADAVHPAGASPDAGAASPDGLLAPAGLVAPGEAMIREVHIYGGAARVGEGGVAAQHHGLGRQLIDRACVLARAAGYARINVISAVGTREYYRRLGFYNHGLYQQKSLG